MPAVGTLADSIERLKSMPAFVEAALAKAPPAAFTRRAADDSFALVEQACHLRDVEREGYLVRVRRILAEDTPALEGFDGAAVAKARDYLAQDARRAAQEFAAARSEVVALLAATTPETLARTATFAGRRITLAELVGMMEEHDREHRGEIEHLLGELAPGLEQTRWR